MLRHIGVRLAKFFVKPILRIGLIVIGLTVIGGAFTIVWKSPAISAETRLQGVAVAATGKQRIEAELITLGPNGFEPKEIRRRPGKPFLLMVENRSGLPVVSLALISDARLPLLTTPLPREKRFWSDVLNLPPGIYALKEADHADWICTIVVE